MVRVREIDDLETPLLVEEVDRPAIDVPDVGFDDRPFNGGAGRRGADSGVVEGDDAGPGGLHAGGLRLLRPGEFFGPIEEPRRQTDLRFALVADTHHLRLGADRKLEGDLTGRRGLAPTRFPRRPGAADQTWPRLERHPALAGRDRHRHDQPAADGADGRDGGRPARRFACVRGCRRQSHQQGDQGDGQE